MTDRESFIAAIRADPACDVPRLVFADWLDEHGESERAELIRVQCELAKLPHCDCERIRRDENYRMPENSPCRQQPCRTRLLVRRESDLFYSERCGLFIPAGMSGQVSLTESSSHPDVIHGYALGHVNRGFLRGLRCVGDVWLQYGDRIYAREPVESVYLEDEVVIARLAYGVDEMRAVITTMRADSSIEVAMPVMEVNPDIGFLFSALWPGVKFYHREQMGWQQLNMVPIPDESIAAKIVRTTEMLYRRGQFTTP